MAAECCSLTGSGKTLSRYGDVFSTCVQAPESMLAGNLMMPSFWALRSVQRFGRDSASGRGAYSDSRHCATGISAMMWENILVQLPITHDGNHWIAPTAENIRSGRYPYAHSLYTYVNKPPGKRLAPDKGFFAACILPAGPGVGVASGILAAIRAVNQDITTPARRAGHESFSCVMKFPRLPLKVSHDILLTSHMDIQKSKSNQAKLFHR